MRRIPHCWVSTFVLAAACTDVNPAYEGGAGRSEGATESSSATGPSDSPALTGVPLTATGTRGGSGPGPDTDTDDPGPDTETGLDGDACVDNGGCPAGNDCVPLDDGTIECACRDGWRPLDDESCVAPTLEPLRVELPCEAPECPNFDNACPMSRESTEALFRADPERLYRVTLRLRGVIEHGRFSGGEDLGWYYEGGAVDDLRRNAFRLELEDPPYHAFVNAGEVVQECSALDQTLTVDITGQTHIRLLGDPVDQCGFRNYGISIPEVDPDNNAFDGQFVQVDLLEVEPL